MDTPGEVYDLILEKNRTANRSRMVAGYCWEWDKSGRNNTGHHDVVIGEFGMSWNLDNVEPFAISETSVHEIGCIHTAQGQEFDYVGVIIGPDLYCIDEQLITDYNKRAKTDQSLRGIKKLAGQNSQEAYEKADILIKNTYRTLMTRGMKGCYVYCTDDRLRDYLRKHMAKD